jgi:hypothetical protein
MVEIVEDLEGLNLLNLDFARAGTDAADLLERIIGRNLRVAAGGGRSSGGACRRSLRLRVLRKCHSSKKADGHGAACIQPMGFIGAADAKITNIVIAKRMPVFEGATFGAVGAYEPARWHGSWRA